MKKRLEGLEQQEMSANPAPRSAWATGCSPEGAKRHPGSADPRGMSGPGFRFAQPGLRAATWATVSRRVRLVSFLLTESTTTIQVWIERSRQRRHLGELADQ